MEEYKLTKDQKKIIKNFIHVGNIAKRRVQTCNNGDDLIKNMKEEKDESGNDLNIRDTLEAHLKQCNQILYETPPGDEWSYLDLVIESPATKETKYGRALEKLKPYMKEYVNILKDAIETHELYKKQKDELEKTGTITSAHWTINPEKIKKEKEELHKEEKIKASRDWQAKFMSELAEMKREHEKTKKGEKEDKENTGQYVESVKKEQKKSQSPYSFIDPSKFPKYTEREFLNDAGLKEIPVNSSYLIQMWENRLIKLGIEDYVAVRGLINCTGKEWKGIEDYRKEQKEKKALNDYLFYLPRYKLKQFLNYTDLCLIDSGIEPSLIRKGTPKCSEKDIKRLKQITIDTYSS